MPCVLSAENSCNEMAKLNLVDSLIFVIKAFDLTKAIRLFFLVIYLQGRVLEIGSCRS